MKIQKRHIVLASLVLALGAAVYLNWQLTDNSSLLNTNSTDAKELGQAKYVNNSVTITETQTEPATDTPEEQAQATLKEEEDAYFADAKNKREQTQDAVVSSIKEITGNLDESDEAKKLAAENLAKIENVILQQSNVENILKAKGFSQCMCYVSDDSCTVVVLKSELEDLSALIIKDAVNSQCGIDFDKITIVEV